MLFEYGKLEGRYGDDPHRIVFDVMIPKRVQEVLEVEGRCISLALEQVRLQKDLAMKNRELQEMRDQRRAAEAEVREVAAREAATTAAAIVAREAATAAIVAQPLVHSGPSVNVRVPPGVSAGQMMQVQAPLVDGAGQIHFRPVQFKIPVGHVAGSTFIGTLPQPPDGYSWVAMPERS